MEAFKKIIRTPSAFVLLLVAMVSLIGVIIKSETDKAIARIPIDATLTAEARLTQRADPANITQTANLSSATWMPSPSATSGQTIDTSGQIIATPIPVTEPPAVPTVLSNPGIHLEDSLRIGASFEADFDTGQNRCVTGCDLWFRFNSKPNYFLVPVIFDVVGGTTQTRDGSDYSFLAVWGETIPDYEDCSAASFSIDEIPVISLYDGIYICFLTDEDRVGFFQYNGVDLDTRQLSLHYITWEK